jgi:hypothetical protein
MRAFRACAVFAILLTTLTVSGQDKTESPKIKGWIPADWGKLALTDQQKKQIYTIQAEFQPKIQAIEKEIRLLKGKEWEDMKAVLTAEQKDHLKAIILKKAGEDDKKDEKK